MSEIKRPVFFSGENPGMTLYIPGTEQALAIASYWYCTDSPLGVGHALVLWLDSSLGQGGIFTDNLDLAQVLVTNLTQHFGEFRDVPLQALDYVDAHCGHTFDGMSYRVVCKTPARLVELEWAEMLDRKQIIWPQFPAGAAAYDLTTVICPYRVGHIRVDGKCVAGEAKTIRTAEAVSSTAFLAFAETWIGPLDRKESAE